MIVKKKRLDQANVIVITLTILLFTAALFIKGIGHDILLEVGVLLVSIKLILATFQIKTSAEEINKKIDQLIEKQGDRD